MLPVVGVRGGRVLLTGAGRGSQRRLESAARGAARELARGEDQAVAVAAAERIGGPGTQVAVSGSGEWVRVEVTRTLDAPSGALGGASWALSADAEARLEPQLLEQGAAQGAGT